MPLPIWKIAMNKFMTSPILGVGYDVIYHDRHDWSFYGHPHSIFVQFLTETGVVGFILFLMFIGWTVKIILLKGIFLYSTDQGLIYLFYLLSFGYFFFFACFHLAVHENYYFWYMTAII